MKRWLAPLLCLLMVMCALVPAQTVIRRPISGAPSFPVNGVIDSFTRPDEGPPPSASWGGIWEPGTADMVVNSNELSANSTGLVTSYWNTNYGPDCEVRIKIVNHVTAAGIAARLVNENTASVDGYLLQYNGGSDLSVYRIDNAGFTALGASITQLVSNGDSIGMSIVGATITVYYKSGAGAWASLGTRSDATYSAAGKLGVRATPGDTTDMDDFGGGTL